MRSFTLIAFVTFSSAMLMSPSALAQKTEDNGSSAAAQSQVKPEDVLKQMADYLGNLPAFSCKVESVLEVTAKEQHNRAVTKMTVRLQRPNKLAMIVDQGVMGLTVVCDGKQLVQYLPMINRYVVKEAPQSFAEMTDIGAPISITMLGMVGDVIPVAGEDYYKNLIDGVTESKYLGKEKVNGVECHHCHFVQEDFDWDIWIEAGKRPVVHKIQPDLTKQLASLGGQAEGVKFNYVVTFADWDVAPKFSADDFKFAPPADAENADTLFETPEEPVHPLVGQAAPAFKTTDVEGKPIDLQKYLGKNVVMLDFWATWCGPCVQAMPEVDGVAKKLKDKGLVFFAVNVGEQPEQIKEFLASSKLDVPVAMDADNKISELYKVSGIPQTLLIGKDGKVQVVHVGFGEGMASALSNEIEDLLAGKDLAGETLKKAEESRKKREANEAASRDKVEVPDEPAPADPGTEGK